MGSAYTPLYCLCPLLDLNSPAPLQGGYCSDFLYTVKCASYSQPNGSFPLETFTTCDVLQQTFKECASFNFNTTIKICYSIIHKKYWNVKTAFSSNRNSSSCLWIFDIQYGHPSPTFCLVFNLVNLVPFIWSYCHIKKAYCVEGQADIKSLRRTIAGFYVYFIYSCEGR